MNDRLKELRKYLGYSQREFAEKLYLSSDLISACEVGRRRLTERNVKQICSTFDVNEEWLLNGNGDMFIDPTRELEGSDEVKNLYKKLLYLEESQREAIEKIIDTFIQNK